MEIYSPFFHTLHDEKYPVGFLGEGTHYSVFRAIVFHDQSGKSLKEGQYHDFAIIWDEDHDERVFEVVEKVYIQGLLPQFVFFGENRAHLTALSFEVPEDEELLAKELKTICNDVAGDRWKYSLGTIRKPADIIDDEPEKVQTYLKNIANLWWLGSKPVIYEDE
ncbi:MAG: hypothetical protein ACRBBN_00090 [Methyloligellaceae bacterium]